MSTRTNYAFWPESTAPPENESNIFIPLKYFYHKWNLLLISKIEITSQNSVSFTTSKFAVWRVVQYFRSSNR